MDSTNRILFVPQHAPSMLTMLPIARKLNENQNPKPLFFLFRKGRFDPEHYRMLERYDIEWTEPEALEYLHRDGGDGAGNKLSKLLPDRLGSVWRLGLHYRRMLHMAKSVLQRERVCALVLMGDRHVGWETSLVAQANKAGVPSLIVPFAMSGPEGGALYRLRKGDNLAVYCVSGIMNRLAAGLFSDWVYEYNGQRLLFYPGSNSLVAQFTGIMPAKPWTLLGGNATRAAVENKFMYDQFVDQGVDRDKMVITGHPGLDASMKELGNVDLARDKHALGVGPEQTLIVFAVPNMAEHSLLPWDHHMRLVEYAIENVRMFEDYFLVLNLHPKSDLERYRYLQEKFKILISSKSIYSLISLSDVYMATHSSTVMQAVGLNKPTIILDYFGIGKSAFRDAPGVVLVDITAQPETLHQALQSMLDLNFYEELNQKQALEADKWIVHDGQSTDRVVAEIQKLISTHDSPSVL